MAKVYRIYYWRDDIQEVEISRETDKCVWVKPSYSNGKERRVLKNQGSERFFNTWEEAHTFILNRFDNNINDMQQQIERSIASRDKIAAMTPPRKEEG